MDKKKGFIIAALVVSLIIAVFLSPLASSSPDGLEKAAEKLGFLDLGETAVWVHSPIPDYSVPFLGETTASGMVGGLVGTLLIFGIGLGLGAVLKKRNAR